MSNARNLARLLPDSSGKIALPSQVSGVLPDANVPSGSVLQVVSAVKTDTFSMTGTTYVDVTGLAATITPISSTSKILVMVQVSAGVSSYTAYMKLKRDSTDILLSDSAGNRARTTVVINPRDTQPERMNDTKPIVYLDSPNTTSAVTYKVALACRAGAMAAYINRCDTDNNDYTFDARTTSTITVMEIAG